MAPSSSTLNVTLSPHDLAAEQLKAEEKQRLLGLFPQYFISYAPDAVPLSAAQKFHLGWKTIIDPVTLLGVGLSAGIQQWRNNYPEFGQGSEGYAKRFGAQYADRVSGVIIGHVVMQSIFHQDPRYFYKGTGSIRSRAMYAIGTAFVVKGDNGHWQPDYSDVLGGLAASEISTLYYPASSRPGRRLVDSVLLGFGGRAANHLLHEFVLGKVTTHVPKVAPGLSPRSLREGTPVSLISVEDWSSKPAENGGLIAFMLASDIKVDGLIVAAIGSKAWGQASFVGARVGDSTAMHVGLERVHLKVGNTDVPLRSTLLQDGGGALEYHRLENSGQDRDHTLRGRECHALSSTVNDGPLYRLPPSCCPQGASNLQCSSRLDVMSRLRSPKHGCIFLWIATTQNEGSSTQHQVKALLYRARDSTQRVAQP